MRAEGKGILVGGAELKGDLNFCENFDSPHIAQNLASRRAMFFIFVALRFIVLG
jgi:hypothetical protein